jgi:hypothetical protein
VRKCSGKVAISKEGVVREGGLRKEFAAIKAIGGSNLDIYLIIAKQAAISGFSGFVVGTALSLAAQPVMAAIGLTLILRPSEILSKVVYWEQAHPR